MRVRVRVRESVCEREIEGEMTLPELHFDEVAFAAFRALPGEAPF